MYKGYRIIKGTTQQINDQIEQLNNLYTNEYIIIENTEDESCKEMRWDGEKFVNLSLPPQKVVKGKNSLQRCAIDMLNNRDITICGLFGGYGSGKTYLALQMALYAVEEKGYQSKIVGIREVIGGGREIGALPGEVEDKVGNFFLPLVQNLKGGEFELERLKQQGKVEVQIPYFLKGMTFNDSIMVVDECEDLTEKQVKLIGTRTGENSRIFFSGDWKQSEIQASENNACVRMANAFKGNPKFACIYLQDDVRSETSKLFANLFE